MTKTMTVGELIKQLEAFPCELPVFFYDIDKEQDFNLEILELNGPKFDSDNGGNIVPFSPYYCKGNCNVEDYWREYGNTIFLCLR